MIYVMGTCKSPQCDFVNRYISPQTLTHTPPRMHTGYVETHTDIVEQWMTHQLNSGESSK